jgi:small-conductance mechanosensitive channel
VETAIRFEIDRLFKERGIVIAFPQRDVHLFVENDADGIVVPKQKTEPS